MTRWLLGAAGLALIGYGLAGAVGSVPPRAALLLAAVVIAHDLVLLPLALLTGSLLLPRLPVAVRGPVAGALFASTLTGLVALPLVLGYGRPADNPSALPRDYAAGLAAALVTIWVAAAILAARRVLGARKAG